MVRTNFYIKYLLSIFPNFIDFLIYKKARKNTLDIVTQNHITLIQFLKNSSIFKVACLNDICVVDNPSRFKNRFEVCYNLLSIEYNFRFFVKTCTDLQIKSLTATYSSANWLEREV